MKPLTGRAELDTRLACLRDGTRGGCPGPRCTLASVREAHWNRMAVRLVVAFSGLKGEAIARAVGVNSGHLSQWLTGNRTMNAKKRDAVFAAVRMLL